MTALVYLGDEVSAAGYRLAGARARVPGARRRRPRRSPRRAPTRRSCSSRAAVAARIGDAALRARARGALAADADRSRLLRAGDVAAARHSRARLRRQLRARRPTRQRKRDRSTGQTQALLDLVEADRAAEVRGDPRRGARAAAALLARGARRGARADARRVRRGARAQRDARIAAARAKLQTRQRARPPATRRGAPRRRLAAAARGARCALARCGQPRARGSHASSPSARAALPNGAWRIAHAPRLARRRARRARARSSPTQPVRADVRARSRRSRAGLKIAAGGNVVDGTLDGLLADRAEIGARLLHALERDAATEAA